MLPVCMRSLGLIPEAQVSVCVDTAVSSSSMKNGRWIFILYLLMGGKANQ